jgi:predicted phosphodiesterase
LFNLLIITSIKEETDFLFQNQINGKMTILMRKIVTLFILLLCFQFRENTWAQSIVYPWRASAAIVKSGDHFEVWFNAKAGQTVQSVSLKAAYNSVATKHSIQMGNWIYDCTSLNTYNTKITVAVPLTAPAERYDIVVNTSSGPVTSLAGVKVIKEYKDSYYILHFSDIHAFQNGYKTTLNRLSTVVDIANIINPEMVFNTGDNLYRPSEDRMNQLFSGNKTDGLKGLNDLKAATFTVVGNHDTDFDKVPEEGFYPEKSKWWNQWWGLQAFNFTYNTARFSVINNGWVGFDPTKQIQEATAWLKKAGDGNFRLGAAHIKESELLDLDKNLNLNMVLVGHNHHIANTNPGLINSKTIQYISNSMRDHVEFNLYKINGNTGIAVPVSGPTAQVEYLENPTDQNAPSLYKPKLVLAYAKANDGTNRTNTAIISNKFNFGIEDARVRFVMPLGTKYSISNGKIDQAFDGQSYHIVDVNLKLEPNSNNEITIYPLQ